MFWRLSGSGVSLSFNNWTVMRTCSGCKPKYNEPTTTIAFRVPESKANHIKEMVNTKLSEWSILNLKKQC